MPVWIRLQAAPVGSRRPRFFVARSGHRFASLHFTQVEQPLWRGVLQLYYSRRIAVLQDLSIFPGKEMRQG